MKKLIALLLLLCMLFSLLACSMQGGSSDNDDNTNTDTDTDGGKQDGITDNTPTVAVPEYKDYGRGTVNFKDLVYARPNLQAVIDAFDAVTLAVKENEIPVAEQIDKIRELEDDLTGVRTMYSLAEIYQSKDSSVEYWQDEYEYISTNYPRLSKTVEELLVACALSDNRQTFETDYFGESLEEYADGGIYTDEVVALMEEEARLEAEYSSLGTATVEIVYDSIASGIKWEGTVDEVIAKAREHFEGNEASFNRVLLAIDLLYEQARIKLEKPLFIELLKVRRLIADELGYDDYSALAYDSMGYDHTGDEMLALLDDIGVYTAPVANNLESVAFGGYFQNTVQPTLNEVVLINNLYEVYSSLGGDYKDAYSYMLQHGLYDVKKGDGNRFEGAFTVYLEDNSSPFIFMNASGFIRDYSTLSHEFGHFLDGYINYGDDESLTVSEISSQALELLTVLKLRSKLRSADYQYLEYYTMFAFLNSVLLSQSFYCAFEHLAYALEYDEITETRLKAVVEDAFSMVFGQDMSIDGDLAYVILPHTMLYPFYVESYVISGVVALDIFFMESYRTGNSGEGFAAYEALIKRGESELPLADRLECAELDSPFKAGKIKEISNNIYFQIIGKNYYTNSDNSVDEA